MLHSRDSCKPAKQVKCVRCNQHSICTKLSKVWVAVTHAGVSGQELYLDVCACAVAFPVHATVSMPRRGSARLKIVLKMCMMSGCRLYFETFALRHARVDANRAPEFLFRFLW